MTAYNGMYRCYGSKQRVQEFYKKGPMAICHVCGRGPLAVYSNGCLVMHKREGLAPPWLRNSGITTG